MALAITMALDVQAGQEGTTPPRVRGGLSRPQGNETPGGDETLRRRRRTDDIEATGAGAVGARGQVDGSALDPNPPVGAAPGQVEGDLDDFGDDELDPGALPDQDQDAPVVGGLGQEGGAGQGQAGQGGQAGAAGGGGQEAPEDSPPGIEARDAGAEGNDAAHRFLPESDEFRGVRVDILDGEIPVSEFLRFLADYTGLTVILDTSQNANGLNNLIHVIAPIRQADAELVKALLEANRWLITPRTLPNGQTVLEAKFAGAPQAPGQTAPTPTPVIRIESDGSASPVPRTIIVDDQDYFADELVTVIYELKHVETSEAIDALNTLVNQGGAAAGPQRGAARASSAPGFNVAAIEGTLKLVITAKFGLVDFVFQLLQIIDVPVRLPERIVHIIEVEEADAQALVQIVEQFLQQRTGTTTRGRTTRQTRAPTQPGAAAPQAVAAGRSADEFQTTLIADPRTQKIIVQTYNQSDLADINMLVQELDTKFDIRRLRTRIYRMRYLKAVDVAPVIAEVLGIGTGGRGGLAGLGTRQSRFGGAGTAGRAGGAAINQVVAPQTRTPGGPATSALGTSLIVPHDETNSLIIQAEPEEYQEIMNILEQIDVKRRQVFLETALVQVSTSSALNYTIELLAGEPDDRDARVLFESSFGLTGIDAENFTRIFPDLTQAPAGALVAFMNRGKFPALVSALKVNTDSEVLATPFILADDNVENEINITETRFVINTNTVNEATTTSQQGEDAGITLNLVPTISSSNAVLLDVQLEVSEFAQAQTAQVLPPKTTNRIRSIVTISDDRIYVVGGLRRTNQTKSVSKVPILGDIPLLGKLFRSEATAQSMTNLYIFFRAHILTAPDLSDLGRLSESAEQYIKERHPDIQLEQPEFKGFEPHREVPDPVNPDAPRDIYFERSPNQDVDIRRDYRDDPENPFAPRDVRGGLGDPAGARPRAQPDQPPRRLEETPGEPFWRRHDLEFHEEQDSWFLPLKPRETARPQIPEKAPPIRTGWLGGGGR